MSFKEKESQAVWKLGALLFFSDISQRTFINNKIHGLDINMNINSGLQSNHQSVWHHLFWICSVHLKDFFRVLLCCFYPEFFDAFALRFGYFAASCSNQRFQYSLNQHILGGEDHVTHVDGQQYHNIYVQIRLVLAQTQTGTE